MNQVQVVRRKDMQPAARRYDMNTFTPKLSELECGAIYDFVKAFRIYRISRPANSDAWCSGCLTV